MWRRLSGNWGQGLLRKSAPEADQTPPTISRHRHHHHRRHRDKNYDAPPLGGNSAISFPAETADWEREERRKNRKAHAARRSRTPSPEGESELNIESTASKRKERRYMENWAEEKNPARVIGTRKSHKKVSCVSFVDNHYHPEETEYGITPAQAVTMAHGRSNSSSSKPRSSVSEPSSSPPSSTGIIISHRQKRRDTNETETSLPYITAAPPSPSQIDLVHRSQTYPGCAPSAPYPATPPAPYPATPPAVELPSEMDYATYHPEGLVPGRSPTPSNRPRSATVPRQGPVPTFSSSQPLTGSVDSSSSGTASVGRKVRHKEDPYTFLLAFQTVFIVDDSASMTAHWTSTRNALETVAAAAFAYSPGGLDIRFLNSNLMGIGIQTPAEVRQIFNRVIPTGCTPTGRALDMILRNYLDDYLRGQPIKPLNIVVLTDGEPTDDPESVIVAAAKRLEKLNAPLHQIGIQFLQIGDDEDARKALMELDDALAGIYGIRDMVDTTRYDEGSVGGDADVVLKALLGGINRRWDRMKGR